MFMSDMQSKSPLTKVWLTVPAAFGTVKLTPSLSTAMGTVTDPVANICPDTEPPLQAPPFCHQAAIVAEMAESGLSSSTSTSVQSVELSANVTGEIAVK